MAQLEEQIIALGIQLVWVLQETTSFAAGNATQCRDYVRQRGSDKGLCVGDGQTMPTARVFDSSPFTVRRGFDMLVRKSDMTILYATSHGTPGGNDNKTGAELLAEIRRITGR